MNLSHLGFCEHKNCIYWDDCPTQREIRHICYAYSPKKPDHNAKVSKKVEDDIL
jgi:hypothetical protein